MDIFAFGLVDHGLSAVLRVFLRSLVGRYILQDSCISNLDASTFYDNDGGKRTVMSLKEVDFDILIVLHSILYWCA